MCSIKAERCSAIQNCLHGTMPIDHRSTRLWHEVTISIALSSKRGCAVPHMRLQACCCLRPSGGASHARRVETLLHDVACDARMFTRRPGSRYRPCSHDCSCMIGHTPSHRASASPGSEDMAQLHLCSYAFHTTILIYALWNITASRARIAGTTRAR